METKTEKKELNIRGWLKGNANSLAGCAGLIFCMILFGTLAPAIKNINIFDISGSSFKTIFTEGVTFSVLSVGAVFVYSLGAMDISIGAQMSLYTVLLVEIYNEFGSNYTAMFFGIFVILIIALLCGAINSVLASLLKIKPIITSLFLQFLLYGISVILFNRWCGDSQSMTFNAGTASSTTFAPFRKIGVMFAVLVIVAVIFTYLFNFTKIGRYAKTIGANQECARQAGVNITVYRMAAYLVFAVAIVMATVVFLANKSAITYDACRGYEMNIIICLILGGMPISGGMKSRISSAIVGSFTYALIDICFIFVGVPSRMTNLFVAIIYIVVVLLTCRDKGRVLPQ
ncbi:MAG: ABC transporter permease [Lachnospiraceae bacterium]|nr:ABC transporter permease [Lachnospiraceae bacterium]